MRAMRIEGERERGTMPLVARARFENTFFGLSLFAGVMLFLGGAYLLTHAIRVPLEASTFNVLVAGFTLALGSFLITYVVWPWSGSALSKHEDLDGVPEYWKGPALTVYGEAVQTRLEATRVLVDEKNLPGPM